jgi:urease accessory protein
MQVIKEPNPMNPETFENSISLTVERRVLAKRRWRGQAEDGTDFGFDLEAPLRHGVCFHAQEDKNYVIEQKPEEVFLVPYPDQQEAAHRAWQVGNLHFPAQFTESYLLVEGDLAVRHMLDRNEIPFEEAIEVFQPVMAASGHHHDHGKILKYFNRW